MRCAQNCLGLQFMLFPSPWGHFYSKSLSIRQSNSKGAGRFSNYRWPSGGGNWRMQNTSPTTCIPCNTASEEEYDTGNGMRDAFIECTFEDLLANLVGILLICKTALRCICAVWDGPATATHRFQKKSPSWNHVNIKAFVQIFISPIENADYNLLFFLLREVKDFLFLYYYCSYSYLAFCWVDQTQQPWIIYFYIFNSLNRN